MDPEGRLFSSIVAKDHSTNAHTKDLDVLMAAEHLALVVDDTEAVWPKHRGNVLQVSSCVSGVVSFICAQEVHFGSGKSWRGRGCDWWRTYIACYVVCGMCSVDLRHLCRS